MKIIHVFVQYIYLLGNIQQATGSSVYRGVSEIKPLGDGGRNEVCFRAVAVHHGLPHFLGLFRTEKVSARRKVHCISRHFVARGQPTPMTEPCGICLVQLRVSISILLLEKNSRQHKFPVHQIKEFPQKRKSRLRRRLRRRANGIGANPTHR